MANRLKNEKSPYLLQHAQNPVDWYPWGEEAFEKAKIENKPIFLSIGYSTCHWCHVMARESFEDERTARILNGRYVSIKVDREERPDIDSIYMKICQQMSGHGGWPLNIFMTPEQVPFYAGTYFPKESRYGIPSFEEVIVHLSETYRNDPSQIDEVTQSVKRALSKMVERKKEGRLSDRETKKAYAHLQQMFDPTYGGFSDAPKFPTPHHMMFLLRFYHLTKEETALNMVEKTLKSMASGGLYDHIGFGFTRYSTDEEWLVPHFEKMLYDNALLLITYIECYQVTEDPFYKKISEDIIQFVQREMVSEFSSFYSAIDADSEGVEGKYYVWTVEEVYDVLGDELGAIYTEVYGITERGNFEGKNIPNLIDVDLEYSAKKLNLSIDGLQEKLEVARKKLLDERHKRVYPHLDDKILTSWNGMMIAGVAKAGKVFGNNHYIKMAKDALQFIENNLMVNGRLMARYREGETKYKGYVDDYAYLLWAYIELYSATYELTFLKKAKNLVKNLIDLFWDQEDGGFFFNGSDSEPLITREKEIHDGAIPSGNSVIAVMLARLFALTGEKIYVDKLEEMYQVFYTEIARYPHGSTFFLQSLLLTEYESKEIVVIGKDSDPSKEELLNSLNEKFLPNAVILVGESSKQFNNLAPFAKNYKAQNDKTTVYVCSNFSCHTPTNNIQQALDLISK